MRRVGLLLLALAVLSSAAESQVISGGVNVSSLIGCATAGTVLVGGSPPACSATPTGLTSLSAGTLTATTSATIGGATPTAITNIRVYTPSITPTEIAAAVGFVQQTVTVTGLTTADTVTVNAPAAPTALCAMTAWWVSAADTLALQYFNATAALCTPAAGVHRIVAIRS